MKPRFCVSVFAGTAALSGIIGAVTAHFMGATFPDASMALWFAAAVGGNAGPLFIDLVRRFFIPAP